MTSSTEIALNPIAGRYGISFRDMDADDAWNMAIDAVDYPVMVKPLHFYHENVERNASGFTNTGRGCDYYGIVVDRDRDGKLSMIGTVTGLYDTMAPAQVYDDLLADLNNAGINAKPRSLYVSGTGGVQRLTVDLLDMKSPNCKDEIKMGVEVITSVDGKHRHVARMSVYNETTENEVIGIEINDFSIATRHTKSIHERHAAFAVTINQLVGEWNDNIMPFMEIMNDSKFDKNLAVEFLNNIMEVSDIPDRHVEKAVEYYKTASLRNNSTEHSVLDVVNGLSQYLNESLGDKPERLEEFKKKIAKKSKSLIAKQVERFKSTT